MVPPDGLGLVIRRANIAGQHKRETRNREVDDMKKRMGLVAVPLLAIAYLTPQTDAIAQATKTPPVWELALKVQLKSERQCDLARVVSVREFKLAGEEAIEGRVRCVDAREFDFSRPKKHAKFELRLCAPATC